MWVEISEFEGQICTPRRWSVPEGNGTGNTVGRMEAQSEYHGVSSKISASSEIRNPVGCIGCIIVWLLLRMVIPLETGTQISHLHQRNSALLFTPFVLNRRERGLHASPVWVSNLSGGVYGIRRTWPNVHTHVSQSQSAPSFPVER